LGCRNGEFWVKRKKGFNKRERNNEIAIEKNFGGLRNLGLHNNNMTEIKTW
jgi:hypothetical protein